MIILDTSVLYALLDAGDGRHLEAVHWYESTDEEMATTPLVLAETDHLVINRAGRLAAQAFRRDASSGAYFVEWWSAAVHEATEVAERYGDLGVSLTDVSLVVLAARLDTLAIATFDERHFRVMRPLRGGSAFRLIPADS